MMEVVIFLFDITSLDIHTPSFLLNRGGLTSMFVLRFINGKIRSIVFLSLSICSLEKLIVLLMCRGFSILTLR
jgi:hypothetical protein